MPKFRDEWNQLLDDVPPALVLELLVHALPANSRPNKLVRRVMLARTFEKRPEYDRDLVALVDKVAAEWTAFAGFCNSPQEPWHGRSSHGELAVSYDFFDGARFDRALIERWRGDGYLTSADVQVTMHSGNTIRCFGLRGDVVQRLLKAF